MPNFERSDVKLGIERVQNALKRLDHPDQGYNILHVGGTNGKGSTVKILESILMAHGYKVAVFSSPFLEDPTEQIRCQGVAISPQRRAEMLQGMPSALSSFERETVLAYCYAREENVDVLIQEVGFGGLQDATNAVEDTLGVAITSIGPDHLDLFGPTLMDLAREKAGIFRRGRPAVWALQSPAVEEVLAAEALARGAHPRSHPYHVKYEGIGACGTRFSYVGRNRYASLCLNLLGKHQAYNAALALSLLEESGYSLTETAVRLALRRVENQGRLSYDPTLDVYLDGAHNLPATMALHATIRTMFPLQKGHILFGANGDKDVESMAPYLEALGEIILVQGTHANARTVQDLATYFDKPVAYHSLPKAVQYLQSQRGGFRLITGSFYLIGDVLRLKKSQA